MTDERTKIEWADFTFNPWVGCAKVSGACDHCYAEGWAKRTGSPELWSGERRRTSSANWKKPLKWNAEAERLGVRYRVFCASLADVFDNQVPQEWRFDLFTLISKTPHLDWLLLTKRPQNMAKMLPLDWGNGWPNVWLGVTAEDQKEANRRVPILLETSAAVRFVSYEPALGPVDFTRVGYVKDEEEGVVAERWTDALRGTTTLWHPERRGGWNGVAPGKIDWIIAGGESGGKARPAHPDWFRSVRDQCASAGVAFHFKQFGEWQEGSAPYDPRRQACPDRIVFSNGDFVEYFDQATREHREDWQRLSPTIMSKVGKKRAGRFLDGVEHNGFPA